MWSSGEVNKMWATNVCNKVGIILVGLQFICELAKLSPAQSVSVEISSLQRQWWLGSSQSQGTQCQSYKINTQPHQQSCKYNNNKGTSIYYVCRYIIMITSTYITLGHNHIHISLLLYFWPKSQNLADSDKPTTSITIKEVLRRNIFKAVI